MGFLDLAFGNRDYFGADGTFDPAAYRRSRFGDAVQDFASGLIAYGMGQPAAATEAFSRMGRRDPAEPLRLADASARFQKSRAELQADQAWNAMRERYTGGSAASPSAAGGFLADATASGAPTSAPTGLLQAGMSPSGAGGPAPGGPAGLMEVIQGLPPQQQAIIWSLPRDQAMTYLRQITADPSKRYQALDGSLIDVSGATPREVYRTPQRPKVGEGYEIRPDGSVRLLPGYADAVRQEREARTPAEFRPSGMVVGPDGSWQQGSAGVAPPGQGAYADRTVRYESGGDPAAKNPRSSATGPGQFIDGTWLDLVKRNRPDLAQGKSDAQILALRTDGALSREMIETYARENAGELAAAGLPVNDATVALAHGFGSAGARQILTAAPNTPVASLVSPAVMQANPHLRGRTAGELVGQAQQRFGGGRTFDGTAAAPAAAPASGAPAQAAGGAPAPAAPRMAPGVPAGSIPMLGKDGAPYTQGLPPGMMYYAQPGGGLIAGPIPGTPQAQPQGPFRGDGMDAQSLNILLRGDPASPEYAAAYARMAAPQVMVDPQTQQVRTITPDMRAFRPPANNGSGLLAAPPPAAGGATGQTAETRPPGAPTIAGTGTPKLPAALQKDEAADLQIIQSMTSINGELDKFRKQIADGKLDLGPKRNMVSAAQNALGLSDEQSRNYASFVATLEKLRADSLLLANGTQTEGDAQRAWDQLLPNINDAKLVKQRLGEIMEINRKAAEFRKNLVQQRRGSNDVPGLDIGSLVTGAPTPTTPAAAAPAPMQPPPQAIEHLRANPALRDAFDQKYGPGAAARAMGAI